MLYLFNSQDKLLDLKQLNLKEMTGLISEKLISGCRIGQKGLKLLTNKIYKGLIIINIDFTRL